MVYQFEGDAVDWLTRRTLSTFFRKSPWYLDDAPLSRWSFLFFCLWANLLLHPFQSQVTDCFGLSSLVTRRGSFLTGFPKCCLCNFQPRLSAYLQKVVWLGTVHFHLLVVFLTCSFIFQLAHSCCPLAFAVKEGMRLPTSSRSFSWKLLDRVFLLDDLVLGSSAHAVDAFGHLSLLLVQRSAR